MTRRDLARRLLAALVIITTKSQRSSAQQHRRPYFMPPEEHRRLLDLIWRQSWAKSDYARLKTAASTGDGFAGAFLYALDGDPRDAAVAQQWLLGKYGKAAYWTVQAAARLNSDFFKGGQVGIPEVYYDIEVSGYLAFDWAYNGLEAKARQEIEEGIVLWSRYKMRAMDRWTQTANLVFKPTSTVAFAGLATNNSELIEWGFRRTGPWGAWIGGYDVVLNTMLVDGGPWHEAPIYPIAHEALLMIARLSCWRGLYDQKDWFSARSANGGSGKGLMDYYIDSAYPIERTGYGPGQIRVASYGDGSTNALGDLILVNPAVTEGNIVMHEPLIGAYNASRDPRYGAFASMISGYTPNLIDHPPLPAEIQLPPAPSKIWPTYGLAMLRSDESPNYWTSGKAIAVFQIMSKGYGHDHRDKFSISLHGGGRLLYPDYNALQYENPSIGWTRNSVAHNTLIIDEGETQDADLTALRHEFSPEVKFLVSSANGVFEGVEQTRALLLTKEYLLDVFHASSLVPHTYDYVLHSFGRIETKKPDPFEPTKALMKRYWLVDDQKGMMTNEAWTLDFIIEEKPGSRGGSYGGEWYEHRVKLRLSMAGEPQTLVVQGAWGNELAKLVAEQQKGATLDQLASVVARRTDQRTALFVACHEPYQGDDQPQVTRVVSLGRTKDTALIRIDAKDFTDYAAVALGPQPEGAEHTFATPGERSPFFAFKNYGYARITNDGAVTLRGDWTGLRLPEARGPIISNGKPATASINEGILLFGKPLITLEDPSHEPLPEIPMPVKISPSIVRLSTRDRRLATFTLKNTLDKPVSGSLQFDLSAGLAVEPAKPIFGPVQPRASGTAGVTIVSNEPAAGRRTVPFHVTFRTGDNGNEVRTAALPLTVVTGPTLQQVYEYPRPYYLIHSPCYTARADMSNGLHVFLADDDDIVRLSDSPLFTLSDGSTEILSERTGMAFTWPVGSPASLTATVSQDRARWQAIYLPDRILIRMDQGWTQFEKTFFTVPGKWSSPQGAPRWKRIVALASSGNAVDALPGAKVKLVGAELEFPEAKWNLAFKFEPAQEVAFNGTELKFAVGSWTNDNWQLGFCRSGELDAWRGR